MKTISGSTDKVGSMIRQAGPETPPQGMKERIMNRIEVVTLKNSPALRPIIGIRGWILIGVSFFALIVSCIISGNTGAGGGTIFFDVGNILRSFPHYDKSLHLDLQIPKPLLFGLAGLLLWFGLDFLLSTLKWKRHISKGKP